MFTPQGDYALYQCFTPCTREVFDSRPVVEGLLAEIDSSTGAVPPSAVPRCPRCGGRTFLNVNIGSNYVIDPHLPALDRLNEWLRGTTKTGLLVLEIGAGHSTPAVIRWPGERIVAQHPNARLIRVTPDHAEVPSQLGGRATAVTMGADEFIAAMLAR